MQKKSRAEELFLRDDDEVGGSGAREVRAAQIEGASTPTGR
jgi:hypothetical protein